MNAAASVSLSEVNDDEINETLMACQSVDEWWEMFRKYPHAGGMTSYGESDKSLYLGVACSNLPPEASNAVYTQAKRQWSDLLIERSK